MQEVEIARGAGIPPGFHIISDVVEGERVYYIRRQIDDRRALIKWKDGEERYTAAFLSRCMFKDGDDENPLLKTLL